MHGQLRKTPCRVFPSDLRLKIQQTGLHTYPDLSIVCGGVQLTEDRLDTMVNPTVLVEVLSPSTENYDRGRKFEHYRTIETLRDYVVVAQDRAHVEHYIRQDEHRWLLVDYYALGQQARLESIGCVLDLDLIYEHVEFGEASGLVSGSESLIASFEQDLEPTAPQQ